MATPESKGSIARGVRARSDREVDSTTPVRTIFMRRGTASTLHQHDEAAAWFHVVSGEIVEERWTRDAEGGFLYEHRRLRKGQSMAAPADTLHRIAATADATLVSTCVCDCTRARQAAAPEIDAVMRLSRSGVDREWATATAIGVPAPAPELIDRGDA